MSWQIWLADIACGVGLAYVSSFAGATLEFGNSLGARAPERDVQDVVTPPWVAMLALSVFLVSIVTLAAGFVLHGPYVGSISIVIVSACVLWTHQWLPTENSSYYRTRIIRAMARRYAVHLRKKDLMRAALCKKLLNNAGIAIH